MSRGRKDYSELSNISQSHIRIPVRATLPLNFFCIPCRENIRRNIKREYEKQPTGDYECSMEGCLVPEVIGEFKIMLAQTKLFS